MSSGKRLLAERLYNQVTTKIPEFLLHVQLYLSFVRYSFFDHYTYLFKLTCQFWSRYIFPKSNQNLRLNNFLRTLCTIRV